MMKFTLRKVVVIALIGLACSTIIILALKNARGKSEDSYLRSLNACLDKRGISGLSGYEGLDLVGSDRKKVEGEILIEDILDACSGCPLDTPPRSFWKNEFLLFKNSRGMIQIEIFDSP